MTIVLAIGYVRATLARQRAVEQAGLLLARRAGDRILALASVRGNQAAESILRPVLALSAPSPDRVFASMRRATDSLRACRCGPLKEGAFFFFWTPSTREYRSTTDHPKSRALRALLENGTLARPREADIWAAGESGAAGPWLIHFATVRNRGITSVVGMDISMDSWWEGTFEPAVMAARRELFPMLADPDTAFTATLSIGTAAVGRSGQPYAGPVAAMPVFPGSEFTLGVALNPAILPLMLVEASPPGYPLLIGSLGASLLVSVLGLLLLRQVRNTMQQREAFVASISHELRTPLTEVLLHAESLELDRNTPEAKRMAASGIVRQTRRVISLVENALTIAGAGRGSASSLAPKVVALAPLVRESLRSLAPALADKRATVDARLDPEVAAAIDPVAFDRIVTNLVENAIRYGPEGQTIGVSLAAVADGIRLEVVDEGPGIARPERTRIFRPFERGASGRGGLSGLGLGLSIVKHLVEAAGGTVAIGDAPGGGARFTVVLPSADGT